MYPKKIFLIIILGLIGFINPVLAEDLNPKDYLASPFARYTTNMMGYNLIAKTVAKKVIKKELNKNIKGKYKVKIGSYSGIDLKKGIFKSLEIEGKNLSLDDSFYFSKFCLNTTSDFNYVDYNKKPIKFITDIPMEYSVQISEEDLNKSIKTDIMNLFSEVIPFVSFQKVKFGLQEDKLVVNTGIQLPFGKNIKMSFSSRLKVVDGKIILADCETTSRKKDFAENLVKIINHYNVLDDISRGLITDVDTKISVKNVKIADGMICVNGLIVLKKV